MVYTEEFRQNALKMVESIGVKKTSKDLHVGEQTLYSWKKKARERNGSSVSSLQGNENSEVKTEDPRKADFDLKQELDELKNLNQSCQQTIEFLVEENAILRQQCENYIMAFRLITQR